MTCEGMGCAKRFKADMREQYRDLLGLHDDDEIVLVDVDNLKEMLAEHKRRQSEIVVDNNDLHSLIVEQHLQGRR